MRGLLGGSRASSPVPGIDTPDGAIATAPVNALSAEETVSAMDTFLGSIAPHTAATEPAPLSIPNRPPAKLAPLAAMPAAGAMQEMMGEYQQWFVEKQDSHQDHSRLRPQAA